MNKIIKEILSYLLIIILVVLIKRFIFSPIRVNGLSMYPTLLDKDIMILNEVGYHINGLNRFDIVVAYYNGDRLIKRVIGFPGEVIEYKDNVLYVNEQKVEEKFEHAYTSNFKLSDINLTVIPKDCYFIVGDNRIDSLDSRIIGVINKKDIRGKTNIILYPFSRFGKVNK